MTKLRSVAWVGLTSMYMLVLLIMAVPRTAIAQEAAPTLTISHFKITSSNGQFIELANNSDQPIDMSTVQLAYYNHYDLTKATSSKLVSLSGILAPHSFYLVNDGALNLCYQTMVASASLSFSSTAGMVQVVKLTQESFGRPFSSQVTDNVAWSRTATPGVVTLPATTLSSAFHRRVWPNGAWQMIRPNVANPCEFETVATTEEIADSAEEFVFLPPVMPAVRFVAPPSTVKASVNRNPGKMAPVINEMLPNPASPQTDADDEFIEFYNPNDSVFDLTGFKLAFGSNNPKKFTFPGGTLLQPKEFKAFTSGDTSISLSNTEAQVWLLDPNEKIIGQSEPYGGAKDGQAWAMNNGTWAWTSSPSPNAINTFSGVAGSAGKSAAAVLGISDSKTKSAAAGNVASATSPTALEDAAPLHPAVLAGIGLLAVGYALYEYRQDISNRIFQIRRYFKLRRETR